MDDFENLTSEEAEVFGEIAKGRHIDEFDLGVVQSLAQKGLLEDFQGSLIVPALVLLRWEQTHK